jgi:hypothetical protein
VSQGPINQEMTIPEIVEKYPATREVFQRYGVSVEGYKALQYENLFASSRVHQIDLNQILSELNQAVN